MHCYLFCVTSGVVVTQLSATDADSGANGWLTYRLESGAQDRFVVDSLSGAVLVGNTTLDREERGSYHLVVMATDRGTPPLSGTATLTVILDDVNDSRPRFIEPLTMINVNESTPPGVVVATLTAEDPDLHPRLEYYIISVEAKDDGNNPVDGLQESFGIDLHTGETLDSGAAEQSLCCPHPSQKLCVFLSQVLCLFTTLSTESWWLRLRSLFPSTTMPARSSISQAASQMVIILTPLTGFSVLCI